MNEVGLGELIVRMVVSLGIVLAIVLGAYALLRRRQGFGGGSNIGSRRTSTSRGSGRSSAGKRGLRIVGRLGVSRTSSVIAVQFAERVFLVGASDHTSPAVLAELSLDDWTSANQHPEESIPLAAGSNPDAGTGRQRSIIDALREATTRRA